MAEIGDQFVIGGRKLAQLKNDELKHELEKRGLKKSGNKAALIERLSEYLFKELYENQQQQQQPVPQQSIQQAVHPQQVGFPGQTVTPNQQPLPQQSIHQQATYSNQQFQQQQQQFQQFNQAQQVQVPFQSPTYQQPILSPTRVTHQQQVLQQIPIQSPGLPPQLNQQQQNFFAQQAPQSAVPFAQPDFDQDQFLQQFAPGQNFNTQQQIGGVPLQQNMMRQQMSSNQIPQQMIPEQITEDANDDSSSSSTIIDEQEPSPSIQEPTLEQQPPPQPNKQITEEQGDTTSNETSANSSQQPSPVQPSTIEPSPAIEQDRDDQSTSSSSSSSGGEEEQLSPTKTGRSALNQEAPADEMAQQPKEDIPIEEDSGEPEEMRPENQAVLASRTEEEIPAAGTTEEAPAQNEEDRSPDEETKNTDEEETMIDKSASLEKMEDQDSKEGMSKEDSFREESSKDESPQEEMKEESPKQEEESPVGEHVKEESGLEEGEVDASSNEDGKENKEDVQETSSEPHFVVEPTEEEKAIVDEPKPVEKKARAPLITKKRKISIHSSGPNTTTSQSDAPRKRRWGSSSKTSKPISTDSLKDIIPGVQVHATPAFEAVMDFGTEDQDEGDERESGEVVDDDDIDKENKEKEHEETEPSEPEAKKRKERIVKLEEGRRKIKLKNHTVDNDEERGEVKMEAEQVRAPVSKLESRPPPVIPVLSQSPVPAERSPSPARNPESVNVHVKNLVRPFTMRQLKELLGKHGTMVEDGFWIDKIKSHCYAVYTDIEGARATRSALHGVKWPPTSPKILCLDYEDDYQMSRDTGGVLGKKSRDEEMPVEPKRDKEKSTEPDEEKVPEEDNSPADLLDNLFRKTKTTPCLYWLPLTAEQIVKRDQEREEKRKRREEERKRDDEEREKRRQEREKEREREQARNRAARDRSRDNRGGARSRSPVRRRRISGSRSRSRSWDRRK